MMAQSTRVCVMLCVCRCCCSFMLLLIDARPILDSPSARVQSIKYVYRMCTIASVTRSRTVLDACNAATEIHYDSSPVAGQLLLNQKRVTHSEEDVDDQ